MRWLLYFVICILSANSNFAQKDSVKTAPAPKTETPKTPTVDPNAPPVLGEVFKPKISLGAGMLSFFGDLYTKHHQPPPTSRIGYDLNVSHRLNRFFQINFNVMFGKLGAFEVTPTRHENFQSEIRCGGLNLMYDFGNFYNADIHKIRPWVSVGIAGFEFLSKTDL